MKNCIKFFLALVLICTTQMTSAQSQGANSLNATWDSPQTIDAMSTLLIGDAQTNKDILKGFSDTWSTAYIPMLLDVVYLSRVRGGSYGGPVMNLLEKKTKQRHGGDLYAWFEWMWNENLEVHPNLGDWKARIHKNIDPKFEKYFKDRTDESLIRLDEVRWGGVLQDGIPPLRQPKMISAEEANYLDDTNVVFGVSINGDHRAYPKRILAWHEMFVDEVGGESIAGVYCTLCGTVIAYNTKFNGENYNLGTSGFLYRSNKLMYDQATQSLWNTIEGKPVIGPLIDEGIELDSHAVVTTTWGEWKKTHPNTTVLSLDTGHRRNYDEGNAYKDYFATDELMFNVPKLDKRLNNKTEVLIVRADGYKQDPLAISARFAYENPVYHDKIGDTNFVVLTDRTGGNRVYDSGGHKFKKFTAEGVKDRDGVIWAVGEEQLTAPDGRVFKRLPYHRIFWFAWFNTFENTRLVD